MNNFFEHELRKLFGDDEIIFRDRIFPHIWMDGGKPEWYAYQPTPADMEQLRQEAEQYLSVFQERTQDGPKLVYICAPLRGDVERNIEFARQKAQEVFQAGNIPLCPHLMFPPIADPENPVQDQAAREMGLRLVETCHQVNVYGTERTDGMREEIRCAMELGIPVHPDRGVMQKKKRQKKDLPQR